MNLDQLVAVLERSFSRDDLRSEYPNYVKRALRSIQQDNNFFCMRHTEDIVMQQNTLSAQFPADFKELTAARSPIFMQATEGDITGTPKWLPCDVLRQEELLRRDAALLLPRRLQTLSRRGPDVYLNTNGVDWWMNIIDVLKGDVTFKVSYFRILPDLDEGSDSNYLTNTYEEMVVNKIKSVAFEDVADPVAADFESLYEVKKKKAVISDARRWVAGRKLQMGG